MSTLKIRLDLNHVKSGRTNDLDIPALDVTLTGTPLVDIEQTIGTAWEAANLVDITDLGYVYIENLDAGNTVEASAASDGSNKLIEAGPTDQAFFKASPDGFYLRSVGGSSKIRLVAFSR